MLAFINSFRFLSFTFLNSILTIPFGISNFRLLHLFCIDPSCGLLWMDVVVRLLWFYFYGYASFPYLLDIFVTVLWLLSLIKMFKRLKVLFCSFPQNSFLCRISSTFILLVCKSTLFSRYLMLIFSKMNFKLLPVFPS